MKISAKFSKKIVKLGNSNVIIIPFEEMKKLDFKTKYSVFLVEKKKTFEKLIVYEAINE